MSAKIRVGAVGTTESRPGRDGVITVAVPHEWGEPPERASALELRAWIEQRLAEDRARVERGEDVPWLAKPEQRG